MSKGEFLHPISTPWVLTFKESDGQNILRRPFAATIISFSGKVRRSPGVSVARELRYRQQQSADADWFHARPIVRWVV